MKYLTWQPGRNRPWTEHNCFPHGAIKVWREGWWRHKGPLAIYSLNEDRTEITFIPPSEWPDA